MKDIDNGYSVREIMEMKVFSSLVQKVKDLERKCMKLNKPKKTQIRIRTIRGLKYVEGIKNHPDPSWFDC